MGLLSPDCGDTGQTCGLSPETAGQCCHWVAWMLTGSCCSRLTGPGGNQADFRPSFDRKSPTRGQHSPARGPHKWLPTSQITQYQGLLCENPHVTTEPCQALNPATLLPVGEGGPSHDCKESLEVYASRPALFIPSTGTTDVMVKVEALTNFTKQALLKQC